MTFFAYVDGERLPLGMDDVVDYLSQFGVVSMFGPNEGWLAKEKCSFSSIPPNRLFFRGHGESWMFFVYVNGSTFDFGNDRLDESVARYLGVK